MSAKTATAQVKHKIAAQPKHVHLHIDLDPETEVFQYRAVVNGEQTVLHRGDSMTFRSQDRFSISFDSDSPFLPTGENLIEAQFESGEWIIPACVRDDAEYRSYPYTVRMSKLGRTFLDQPEQVHVIQGDPEVIIVQV